MSDESLPIELSQPAPVTVGIIARQKNPGLLRLVDHLTDGSSPRPAEVIVAVECPGAESIKERRDARGIRWLDLPAGQGLGFNRNRLVEAVTSDVLVFADDDCEPEDGWLGSLLGPLADPSVDAVVGSVRIPSSNFLGDAISALGFPAGGTAGFETMFKVRPDRTTDNLTTCNCAIRMAVFKDLGGFDEGLMSGGEDTEFGVRMRDSGKKLVYHGTASVVHGARSTMSEFVRWFYRRGRAKRQFVKRVHDVGPFVGQRLSSYGRILHSRRRDPKLIAIVPLLFASVILQQAGFVAEALHPTQPLPWPPGDVVAPPAPVPLERGGGRSVARGTILGVSAQAWQLASAFILYAFLARQLGPALFGRWKLVLSVLNWFELAINSALVKVAVKSIAERPSDRPRLMRSAYIGQGVIAAGLLAAALILAWPIASSFHDPTLRFLLQLSALDIPMYALFMVAASILLGVQRFERQAVGITVYATAKFVLIGGLVAGGLSVPGALLGNILASFFGFAVTFRGWGKAPWATARREATVMGVAAVPFLVLNLTDGLFASAGLWAAQGLVGNAVLVGFFAGAVTLAEVPAFLFIGLNRVLFPSVARAHARDDAEMAARYARQAVRVALLLTVLGVALTAATGKQLLQAVYGPVYAAAFLPLAILMVAAAGRAVEGACIEVLMAKDRRRKALIILGVAVLFEFVLLGVLTPMFGLVGAAVATAIAAVSAAIAYGLSLRTMLGRRVLWTLARSVAAAAPVAVALRAIHPSPLGLIIAYPLATLGYAGLLRLLGEIDDDDMGSFRGAFRRASKGAREEGGSG